jgi:hypothetical protein
MTAKTKEATATYVAPSRARAHALLDDLPPESVGVAERFLQFLREQARRGQPVVTAPERADRPPYLYPTVLVPASSLKGLTCVMPPVGGDALADAEALYDEV